MFKDKRVLVTGSNGLIGKELVIMLKELGAKVIEFDKANSAMQDVTEFTFVYSFMKDHKPDYVFHLFGIKGSPFRTDHYPVDFMGPMLQGDTNTILAAMQTGVKKFLYTSSIAVEHPGTDKYPAHAKLTAELLLEASKVQSDMKSCIVRPANVYGRFDSFDTQYPMVVTSMIKKAKADGKLELWGGGKQVRDFINARDCARGMIKAMKEMPNYPVNLCSGEGITIKRLAEAISSSMKVPLVHVDKEAGGDASRVMKLNWDFKPKIDIETGIKEVVKCIMTNSQ